MTRALALLLLLGCTPMRHDPPVCDDVTLRKGRECVIRPGDIPGPPKGP